MSRVSYEIGARGSDEGTTAFRQAIMEKYDLYYAGRFISETTKSVHARRWLDTDTTVVDFTRKLTGWCAEWSKQYPDLEVFWLLTEEYERDAGVKYATFRDGEFYHGATLIRHDDFVDEFGDCDCTLRDIYYEKYPPEAPFRDCPVRLNPPTAWAVEHIMYANDIIGARR